MSGNRCEEQSVFPDTTQPPTAAGNSWTPGEAGSRPRPLPGEGTFQPERPCDILGRASIFHQLGAICPAKVLGSEQYLPLCDETWDICRRDVDDSKSLLSPAHACPHHWKHIPVPACTDQTDAGLVTTGTCHVTWWRGKRGRDESQARLLQNPSSSPISPVRVGTTAFTCCKFSLVTRGQSCTRAETWGSLPY